MAISRANMMQQVAKPGKRKPVSAIKRTKKRKGK